MFTSRNITWTGLPWGEYEKISPENYFYKTVVVLDSDENEDERLINIQGPNAQRERTLEVLNANNEENGNFHSGRGIRDGPLWLNINVPENFDEFQDLSINTPSYADQMESVGSPPINTDKLTVTNQETRALFPYIVRIHCTPHPTLR